MSYDVQFKITLYKYAIYVDKPKAASAVIFVDLKMIPFMSYDKNKNKILIILKTENDAISLNRLNCLRKCIKQSFDVNMILEPRVKYNSTV